MARDALSPAQASLRATHWRRTRRFTLALLAIWFVVTFGAIFFARALSEIEFFGWSLSYYMAAQGTIFIYVFLVAAYAWYMPGLDRTLSEAGGDGE